jgi:hypothetical protein
MKVISALLAVALLPKAAPAQAIGEMIQTVLRHSDSKISQELLEKLGHGQMKDAADLLAASKVDDSVKLTAALRAFSSTQNVSVQALSEVTGSKYRIAFVWADLKRFSDGFAAGGNNPDAAFDNLRDVTQKLVAGLWRLRPRSEKVGIICSREDLPFVQKYQAELEKKGRMVYVYTVCEDISGHLCPNEAVGAFMATAGEIHVMTSPAARKSSFVMREITMAQQIRAEESTEVILITPENLAAPVMAQVVLPDNSSN